MRFTRSIRREGGCWSPPEAIVHDLRSCARLARSANRAGTGRVRELASTISPCTKTSATPRIPPGAVAVMCAGRTTPSRRCVFGEAATAGCRTPRSRRWPGRSRRPPRPRSWLAADIAGSGAGRCARGELQIPRDDTDLPRDEPDPGRAFTQCRPPGALPGESARRRVEARERRVPDGPPERGSGTGVLSAASACTLELRGALDGKWELALRVGKTVSASTVLCTTMSTFFACRSPTTLSVVRPAPAP